MFRKNLPSFKNLLFFSFFLTSFVDWVAADLKRGGEDADRFNGSITSLTSTSQMLYSLHETSDILWSKPITESRIFAAIEFENYPVSTYTTADQQADKHFLVQNLMEMQQSYDVDYCKLFCLLNFMPAFKFKFSSEFDRKRNSEGLTDMRVDSGYAALDVTLELPAHSYHANDITFKQTLSHELNHAIDAFNNFKARRCLTRYNNKMFPLPYIHGAYHAEKIDNCSDNNAELLRVYKLFKKDIDRINVLLAATEKNKLIKNLSTLLQKYNYKHTLNVLVYGAANAAELEAVLQENNYLYIPEKNVYKAQNARLEIEMNNVKYTVLEYSPLTKNLITTLTNPRDLNIANLQRDILLNIVHRLEDSQADSLGKTIMEMSSAIDEVLAPYSHQVKIHNKAYNLRQWLFPNLVEYQRTRMSDEHLSCLNQTRRLH